MKAAIVLGAALSLCTAEADTLTWKSDVASGAFSSADNWTSDGTHTAPQSGDTCVFPNSEITLTAETFDIGASGITINNPAKLTINTTFTGTGAIVKKGGGLFETAVSSTFSGGTTFYGGQWTTTMHHSAHQFGTGAITFDFDSSNPFIDIDKWDVRINTPIVLKGTCTAGNGALFLHQTMTFLRPITSEQDFTIAASYGPYGGFSFKKPISCPGKTLTMRVEHTTGDYVKAEIFDAVDGSLVKIGSRDLILSGASKGCDNKLTVSAGKCQLTAAGRWDGTNVVVSGSTAILDLQGKQNLSPAAVISVSGSGKLSLGAACKVFVCGLVVNGVEKAAGTYTSTNLSDVITGNGSIVVKPITGKVHYWVGDASGAWSAAANWKDGTVPVSGDMAVFDKVVALAAENVDIGNAGISLVNHATLTNNASFGGNGGIEKFGDGALITNSKSKSTFAGGVLFHGGQWCCLSTTGYGPLGTGPLTFDFDSASPYVDIDVWGPTLANDVILKGKCTSDNGALHLHQTMTVKGTITSDEDFRIYSSYGRYNGFVFQSAISCPGKTLTMMVDNGDKNYIKAEFRGPLDGSLVKIGRRDLILSGQSNGLDDKLTVSAGKCIVSSTGHWGGTNVVVNGSTAILQLEGNQNLSEQAVVAVANSGTINVASGKLTHVARMTVDDAELAPGRYDKNRLPSVFTGDGKLVVGKAGFSVIVK